MSHHLFISASTVCLVHRFAGNFIKFTFTRSLGLARSRELYISNITKKFLVVKHGRALIVGRGEMRAVH